MNDFEKELMTAKVLSNQLSQKATLLLLACELIAEYRQLNNRLLTQLDSLKRVMESPKYAKPPETNGPTVPVETQQTT
jgi:hypothetical protein